ncbi:hypothetical protein MYX64_06065 [Nitrospinae bacterium AH_259_B05_G02_I21]|nr:hypothetical protein [Nitrospinae bacterium AH_259_B05_G02_I21]MDA2931783.1 hypothetical protein [Nitrospinae bacterium AH-259-F20]
MVQEIASNLANTMVEGAYVCAEKIRNYPLEDEESKEAGLVVDIDDVKFADIFLEFLVLFIHMADRLGVLTLDDHKRKEFMDILVEGAMNSSMEMIFAPDMPSDQRELAQETLYKRLNWTNLEFMSMNKLFAEKDEDLKGTLMWEFAKGLSQLIVGDDYGIAYIYLGVDLATNALEMIDIQNVLDQVSM